MVIYPTHIGHLIRSALTAAALIGWFAANAHGAGLALAQINQGVDHIQGARTFVSSVASGGSVYDEQVQ